MDTIDKIGLGMNTLEKTFIVEKILESHLMWFGHVRRRFLKALVTRVDQMKGSPIVRVERVQEKL